MLGLVNVHGGSEVHTNLQKDLEIEKNKAMLLAIDGRIDKLLSRLV